MWISPSKRLRRCDDIIIVRDFVHSQNKYKRKAFPFGDRFSLSLRIHLIIPGLAARLACVRSFKNSWRGASNSVLYTPLSLLLLYWSLSFFSFTIFLVVTRRLCSRADCARNHLECFLLAIESRATWETSRENFSAFRRIFPRSQSLWKYESKAGRA